jgi:hypothetical protein
MFRYPRAFLAIAKLRGLRLARILRPLFGVSVVGYPDGGTMNALTRCMS